MAEKANGQETRRFLARLNPRSTVRHSDAGGISFLAQNGGQAKENSSEQYDRSRFRNFAEVGDVATGSGSCRIAGNNCARRTGTSARRLGTNDDVRSRLRAASIRRKYAARISPSGPAGCGQSKLNLGIGIGVRVKSVDRVAEAAETVFIRRPRSPTPTTGRTVCSSSSSGERSA